MKVPSHKAVLRLPLCVWLLITVARIEGYIPVEIAESAKVANLNLFLRQGLCGSIGYSNEEGTTNNNAQTH